VVQDSDTFCRLVIHGLDDLLVDLALDSAPGRPAIASIAGPRFAPAELAGRKLIALCDRAAARDSWTSSRSVDRSARRSCSNWREVDAGFDVIVFVEMIGLLSRYSDVHLELGDVNAAAVRAFFSDWSAGLQSGQE